MFIDQRKISWEREHVLLPWPQELTDTILDFLHNDVAALCSAGLVCKSWLPASRLHVFSEFQLSQAAVVHHGLEVICAESSTIPPYILHLSIASDESQFVDETLLKFPLLSNLKRLWLTWIDMANLTPDAKKKLTTKLQNLTTLHLNDFTVRNTLPRFILTHLQILEQFETVDQAVDFIASAPCLEDIQFSSVGCIESCNYSSQAIAPPLRKIRFGPDPLLDNLMDWFCRSRPTPSVHTLDINQLTSRDNIPTVCNFIRHLGSALENLMISCSDSDHGGVQSKRPFLY